MNKRLELVIATWFIMIALCLPCFAKSWKGLVPLHSSKDEVEKILGKGDVDFSTMTYRTKKATVYVTYSPGTCKESPDPEWEVLEDIVISISVYHKGLMLIDELDENLAYFVKTPGVAKDLPGIMDYTNDRDGVSFSVDTHAHKKGAVMNINYYPMDSDEWQRCSKKSS